MEVFRGNRSRKPNFEVIDCSPGKYPLQVMAGDNWTYFCSICDTPVTGNEVIQQGEQNYCWRCFQNKFGLKCAFCLNFINGESKMNFVFYNGQVWHWECFRCRICGKWQGKKRDLIQEKNLIYCKQCGEGSMFRFG